MGSSGATVTLTIASAGFPSGGGVPIAGNRHSSQLVLACVGLGALLLPFGRRLRRRSLRLLATGLLLIACAGAVTSISGCGTGWNHENFSLDITADSGTLTHTISTTLSVH